jgi:hypothetical protein
VASAPPILTAVKRSPVASQATTPATSGIRYISGAVLPTPRCSFTQPHTSQPRKADTSEAHRSRPQCSKPSCAQGTSIAVGRPASTSSGLPAKVA